MKTPAIPKENHVKPTPPQRVLREILDYNPKSGELRWKARTRKYFKSDLAMQFWNGRYAGGLALNYPKAENRLYGNIFNSSYSAHRIIWKWMTGKDLTCQIDHINRDPSDNRWVNLRKADRAQNFWNSGLRSSNTSGRKGVSFDKARNQWLARISYYHIRVHIGRFDTFEQACIARSRAEKKYHKNFTNQ